MLSACSNAKKAQRHGSSASAGWGVCKLSRNQSHWYTSASAASVVRVTGRLPSPCTDRGGYRQQCPAHQRTVHTPHTVIGVCETAAAITGKQGSTWGLFCRHFQAGCGSVRGTARVFLVESRKRPVLGAPPVCAVCSRYVAMQNAAVKKKASGRAR